MAVSPSLSATTPASTNRWEGRCLTQPSRSDILEGRVRDELFQLIHEPSGTMVASRLVRAGGFPAKGIGLIGRPSLPAGHGLWLEGVSSVHTLGLKFAIDLLFLTPDNRTVDSVPSFPPNRLFCGRRGARSVMELPAGALAGIALSQGDRWILRAHDRAAEE